MEKEREGQKAYYSILCKQLLIIIFFSPQCPVSLAHSPHKGKSPSDQE